MRNRIKNVDKRKSRSKGITLIVLIITIVILIILATVAINFAFGGDGLITRADQAALSAELSTYKEQLDLYKASKFMENDEFEEGTLTAGKVNLSYNTKTEEETGNITTVIPSISDEYTERLEVIKGELLLTSQNMTEIRIAQALGIEVNPYLIVDGVLLSANTNLALMDEETGSLTLPDSVTAIGEGAFANLSGLKTIIIPGTVKEIRQNAFRNNVDLENVIIQEGVEIIGQSAFDGCSSIVNVELPESLTSIEMNAFSNCSNLINIKIPSNIETIRNGTFYRCINLEKVELPNNLKAIESTAFSYCMKLNNVYIPKNVTSIEDNVFRQCINLVNITIDSENTSFAYENGLLMTQDMSNILFISDKQLKSNSTFEIPEGVIEFGYILDAYNNITSIVIPSSLENISNIFPESVENVIVSTDNLNFTVENDCLYNKGKTELIMCFTKDTTVELSDVLETIGTKAFFQAINLTNIELPDSVMNIYSQAFFNNDRLENISIGKNVRYISANFKSNYSGTVTIDRDNPYYTIENNILYNKDKTNLITVMYKIEGKFIVDSNVKILSQSAFSGQKEMTEIQLPDGLEEIIGNTFTSCSGLTSIYIPNSVETISSDAFSNCDNLTQIQIDKKVGSITGSPWGAIRGDRIVEWLR